VRPLCAIVKGHTMTATATLPHTRIENSIIANIAEIGVYCFTVYAAIKMHVNQASGGCFPSYARLARMTGIHRSTVIECVKKLRALNLVDPQWRFKDDGSHASNQYNFQEAGDAHPATESEVVVKTEQAGRPERPLVVGGDDHPGRPQRPEQSEPNKKKRTITDVDFIAEKTQQTPMPTDRQKTCQHPLSEIVFLADDVTICHHCYGLLDENFKLRLEEKDAEIVAA